MFVQMVSLVYLIGSYQNLLVKDVKSLRKRDTLRWELFSHQIWSENVSDLLTGMALNTQQVLEVIANFHYILRIETSLFLCCKKACKWPVIALHSLNRCDFWEYTTKKTDFCCSVNSIYVKCFWVDRSLSLYPWGYNHIVSRRHYLNRPRCRDIMIY